MAFVVVFSFFAPWVSVPTLVAVAAGFVGACHLCGGGGV